MSKMMKNIEAQAAVRAKAEAVLKAVEKWGSAETWEEEKAAEKAMEKAGKSLAMAQRVGVSQLAQLLSVEHKVKVKARGGAGDPSYGPFKSMALARRVGVTQLAQLLSVERRDIIRALSKITKSKRGCVFSGRKSYQGEWRVRLAEIKTFDDAPEAIAVADYDFEPGWYVWAEQQYRRE